MCQHGNVPVHTGDSITIERRILGIEEKQGKHGQMHLTRAEATYVNQRGVLVARAIFTHYGGACNAFAGTVAGRTRELTLQRGESA